MRQVMVLNDSLPQKEKIRDVIFVDGKRITLKEAIKLLEVDGHNIETKSIKTSTVAAEYKGIEISSTLWGKVIWAKDIKKSDELQDYLVREGYFARFCRMPVELKSDSTGVING